MISVLHCRVLSFFRLVLTFTSRFLKAIYKGFVFLVIVQFSRYRCAFSQKCLSIISHFFTFVKRFLKYFFISFSSRLSRSSGDLFILPPFAANVNRVFTHSMFCTKPHALIQRLMSIMQDNLPVFALYTHISAKKGKNIFIKNS